MIPGSAPDLPPKNIGGGGGSVGTLRITWDVSSTVYNGLLDRFLFLPNSPYLERQM